GLNPKVSEEAFRAVIDVETDTAFQIGPMFEIVDDQGRLFRLVNEESCLVAVDLDPQSGPCPGHEIDIGLVMAGHFAAHAIELPIGIGKILAGPISPELDLGPAIGRPD